jgi:hypothetical protein
MKISARIALAFGLFTVLIGWSAELTAQNRDLPMKEDFEANVRKFLQSDRQWKDAFKGEFIPLPKGLQTLLDSYFAKHWFTIAVIETGDPRSRVGIRHNNLLLAVDKKTARVIGHSWGFGPCSEGFRTILSDYQWILEDYGDMQLKTLGDLLLFTLRADREGDQAIAPRVGRILDKGRGVIDVELILQRTAYRLLRVRKDAKGRFTRISFVEPGFKEEY